MMWECACPDFPSGSSVEKGRYAERLVCRMLEERIGLKPMDANWYSSHKELDLIMEDDSRVHIIEVRSRSTLSGISPCESVGRKKRNLLAAAASSYAVRRRIRKEIVFDVASVVFVSGTAHVEYVPDAFMPGW